MTAIMILIFVIIMIGLSFYGLASSNKRDDKSSSHGSDVNGFDHGGGD